MTYTPEHLERWSANVSAFDSAANYCGADLSAFYVAPISNGRDTCDSVTLSNWRVISAELEQLAKHDESGVARFGHWAVGWYELWLIHESDGPSFNFREAAEQLTAATLSQITGLKLLEPSQEWRREAYPWAGAEPSPLEPALA